MPFPSTGKRMKLANVCHLWDCFSKFRARTLIQEIQLGYLRLRCTLGFTDNLKTYLHYLLYLTQV